MSVINSKNTACVGQGKFETEASELGWAPGRPIDDVLSTDLGNGCHFYLIDSAEGFGGWTKLIYQQIGTDITLTVWND